MNLLLPETIEPGARVTLTDFKRAIFVGANGTGKTRIGVWLDLHNTNAHRISAQKALDLPDIVRPLNSDTAKELFFYGQSNPNKQWLEQVGKREGRWHGRPETHTLNDFENLVTLLHSEEYDAVLTAKASVPAGQAFAVPPTKLDRLLALWESVLPHRKLIVKSGTFNTSIPGTSTVYPSSQMSDGERVVFYYIGEVLCSKPNSIIIVDEPENHVHKAIQSRLWDEIENSRQDCAFVYLTHDIDFAVSRTNAKKVWVKKFENNLWDYELLSDTVDIPEAVYFEVLGSRKDILFIEGDKSSLDYHLYKEIFRYKTVEPLISCNKVISATRSFNELHHKHRLNASGLVDRDRRNDVEIQALRNTALLIPEVAEVENFFLLEGVVRAVAGNMHQDPDTVFAMVRTNVIAFFNQQLNRQVAEHSKYRLAKIAERGFNGSPVDQPTLEAAKAALIASLDVPGIYNSIRAEFEGYAQADDYPNILKVFNNKGITATSAVAALCNIANGGYHSYVLEEMMLNTETGNTIRGVMNANIH
jgi:hypothetical protein